MSCIFCKIVKGEVPCVKIHEDADVLAFLDIAPIEPGHTLIIPKVHFATFMELPDPLAARLAVTVREIADRVHTRLQTDGITLSQANGACAGQVVPHVHVHVIPRFDHKDRHWRAGRYASDSVMRKMAATLAPENVHPATRTQA